MRKITFSILFSLCCVFGFAQTFPGTGTPTSTQGPGGGTAATCGTPNELNLTVDVTGVGVLGSGNILDQVDIDITHTWAGDINVTLIAPDGTTSADLTSGNGGSADNYTGTQFRDDAATSITAGTAPFTGAFQPEQPLSTFNGVDADGTWTLNFCDSAGGDVGTFNSWSITFVPGVACLADAGTLTADANPVELNGTTTISATPNGDINVPTDYEVTYVLTEGPTLVIQDVSTTAPSFDVTVAGDYTIHTLVAETSDNTDPNFLDLSVVVPGTTTGGDVLDIINNNSLCASLDVTGAPITVSECIADAGTLTADANPVILSGTTTISATADGNIVVPTDYEVLYVLTEGPSLVIQQVSTAAPSFDVTAAGDYTIHTLVAETSDNTSPDFLDLSVVVLGTTTGGDVLNIVTTNGLCASLDVAGAPIAVIEPAPNDLCENAEALAFGVLTNGTTFGATGASATSCNGTIGNDVWYTITGDGGDLTVLVDAASEDQQIGIFESADCTGITLGSCDFSADGFQNPESVTFPSINGATYYIQVGAWIDSGAPSTFDITVTSSLSTDSFETNEFSYYPNPVENTLTLNAASSNIQNVVMFNMLGQQVMQVTPNSLNSKLDMSNLQTGTYFVRVTVANVTKTIRVVKQ
jgi:subtilisin-like proprotein convertase family protein